MWVDWNEGDDDDDGAPDRAEDYPVSTFFMTAIGLMFVFAVVNFVYRVIAGTDIIQL